MTDPKSKYPPFNRARFTEAVRVSALRWQELLRCQHWFLDGVQEMPDDWVNTFGLSWCSWYRSATVRFCGLSHPDWRISSDEEIARNLAHEVAHLLLAPLRDIITTTLAGKWQQELTDVLEQVVEHIATAAWHLVNQGDRDLLIKLIADAREKPHKRKPKA